MLALGAPTGRRQRRGLLLAVPAAGMLAAGLLAGCGHPQEVLQSGTVGANAEVGDVLLRNVYVQSPPATGYPAGSDAVVRLTLLNQADRPDALVGVSSDVATRADIRRDTDCDGAAETVPSLALPARVDSTSPPSGPGPNRARYVVRLADLRVGVLQGGSVPITFTFRNAGAITVPTPVDGTAGPAPSPAPCPSTG